jgi:prepilin-type N-terminal cleavage/methylation domain-containing protein
MHQHFLAKFHPTGKNRGFTLVELVVAMAITGILLAVGGSGLVYILSFNQQAETNSNLRIDLHRALEFIADDARESNNLSTTLPTSWTGWTIPTGYTGVFFLTKPAGTPGGSQVAYYKRQKLPGATSPEWRGPEIIYRATTSNTGGDALVDSIRTGGFSVPTIIAARQATLSLAGQICTPPTAGNACTNPKSLTVSTQVFARAE